LIMGLTYKENVADTRETPVKEVIRELKEYGVEIWGYDPLLDNIGDEFAIKSVQNLQQAPKVDGVILAVAHDAFTKITPGELKELTNNKPILIDVRRLFNEEEAKREGLYYKSL